MNSTLEKIEETKMHIVEDNCMSFEALFEVKLPKTLKEIYGSNLRFLYDPEGADIPLVHVNFVMSKEGIFNIQSNPGGGPISQGNTADPFVMALLRANADAVMVGANTLNSESGHIWTFEFIFDVFPQMRGLDSLREEFSHFRSSLEKKHKHPPVFFMTNSGNINPEAEVFRKEEIVKYIVSGKSGAEKARTILRNAKSTEVLYFGEETLNEFEMFLYLKRKLGIKFLLHEGGRGVVSSLVEKGLVSEFFLTHMNISPSVDIEKENVEYLFSTEDHMPPKEARIIDKRVDATGSATFLNLDFRNVLHI